MVRLQSLWFFVRNVTQLWLFRFRPELFWVTVMKQPCTVYQASWTIRTQKTLVMDKHILSCCQASELCTLGCCSLASKGFLNEHIEVFCLAAKPVNFVLLAVAVEPAKGSRAPRRWSSAAVCRPSRSCCVCLAWPWTRPGSAASCRQVYGSTCTAWWCAWTLRSCPSFPRSSPTSSSTQRPGSSTTSCPSSTSLSWSSRSRQSLCIGVCVCVCDLGVQDSTCSGHCSFFVFVSVCMNWGWGSGFSLFSSFFSRSC